MSRERRADRRSNRPGTKAKTLSEPALNLLSDSLIVSRQVIQHLGRCFTFFELLPSFQNDSAREAYFGPLKQVMECFQRTEQSENDLMTLLAKQQSDGLELEAVRGTLEILRGELQKLYDVVIVNSFHPINAKQAALLREGLTKLALTGKEARKEPSRLIGRAVRECPGGNDAMDAIISMRVSRKIDLEEGGLGTIQRIAVCASNIARALNALDKFVQIHSRQF